MPESSEIEYMRRKAKQFRALADRHAADGEHSVAGKLVEVARELSARVGELEKMKQAHAVERALRSGVGTTLALRLSEVLRLAVKETGADKGTLQLIDDRRRLQVVASHGFDVTFLDFFRVVDSQEDCACGAALRMRERIIVSDVMADPLFAGNASGEVLRLADCRSVQSTPIVGRSSQLLGMISTHRRKVWSPEEGELRCVDEIAQAIAVELEAYRFEAL